MTRVHLQLAGDGDGEPLNLDTRHLPGEDHLGAYALASWLLETAARLVAWQAFRDRTRAEFDSITEGLEEAS